jgi:hypothetical protein
MIVLGIYLLVAAAVWLPFWSITRRNSPLLGRLDAATYAAAGAITWPISLIIIGLEILLHEEI